MFRLQNFTFTYAGAKDPALRDLSFQIAPGERLALVGGSGAGKSTLLRALAGLIPHLVAGQSQGRLLYKGQDWSAYTPLERAQSIALVGPNPELQLSNLSTTVAQELAWGLENLALPYAEIERRVAQALERWDLTSLACASPFQLSSGQRQRLALAASFITAPRFILLDEPSAYLDHSSRRQLVTYLQELPPEVGWLWATSRLEEVVDLERWLFLEDGRLLSDAPPQLRSLQGPLAPAATRLWALAHPQDPLPQEGYPLTLEAAARHWQGAPLPVRARTPLQREEPPLWEASGLSYAWGEASGAGLEEIAWTLPAGQRVALVGPNGAGKSTLARLWKGLLSPQAGVISYKGRPIPAGRPQLLASELGLIGPDPRRQIFAAQVREEILFGARQLGLRGRELEERLQESLELTGLEGLALAHPYELTNSQLRRLGWASILALHTPTLLVDEPSALGDALDWEIWQRIEEWLLEKGTTLILISHDWELLSAREAEVWRLEGGRLEIFPTLETYEPRLRAQERPAAQRLAALLSTPQGQDNAPPLQIKEQNCP